MLLLLAGAILAMSLMPLAAAPKPGPPPPVPPTPITNTGHEAYPYAGDPPQGHEQGIIYNSFSTPEQQGLYSKFVGFRQDYT